MSFLTTKHLSRRTVLKGAGATIALPLLDAMIPAGTAFAQTLAASTTRLGFVYFPHKRHVQVGLQCQTCHGAVQGMIEVAQVAPLTMGWCVSCHSERKGPLDCVTCHH